MNIINIYLLFIPLIVYFFLNTPKSIHKTKGWYYKLLLIYVSMIFITISILKSIKIIDEYILPLLLFINIAYLIYITLSNKYTLINLLPIIGILYLLYTFDYRDFKIKNGILVNPNKTWIMNHIFILALWYLLQDNSVWLNKFKIYPLLWLVYPLLFPIEEYFIHRVFILSIISSFVGWY